MKIENLTIASLVPYARNARTHSDAQVAQIAGSIREFGFCNPVLVDADGGIIAGHGRVLAARKLGMVELPCVRLGHLTDVQRRAYVLADNKLALNAGWDEAMLALELESLDGDGFKLDLLGFDADELDDLLDGGGHDGLDDSYSRKVEAPIYEPTGPKPKLSDLVDEAKAKALREEIDAADIQDDIKEFLRISADRHTVFNFRNIAEYYAHSEPTIQALMEKSALVIIDFDKAIENGFVALTEKLGKIADQEVWNGQDA
jgi:ParB-like nuclease domain